MKIYSHLLVIYFISIVNSIYAQDYLRDQIISDIESVIRPQYGEEYMVDIDFADSMLSKFSESGFYKFEDSNHFLDGCVLFSAVKFVMLKLKRDFY